MVAKMKRAGIFRASTPKRFGGDALPPPRFLEMLERIAIADGSAAWVAAFGSANTYLASLPVETQARIYASGPDQVFSGGLYPLQKAERAPGGFLVSGQWRFASGCKGADWIGVGIGGAPGNAGDSNAGKPFTAVFPASEVEIVDNWNVVGMQGTGSHDLRLANKFVDEQWTFVRGGAPLIDEPLYRYPAVAYQAQVHAAVNIGLARAALDLLAGMSGVTKTTTGAPRLADRAYYRAGLAQAEANLRSARAFFFESAETSWRTVLNGRSRSCPTKPISFVSPPRMPRTHAPRSSCRRTRWRASAPSIARAACNGSCVIRSSSRSMRFSAKARMTLRAHYSSALRRSRPIPDRLGATVMNHDDTRTQFRNAMAISRRRLST